MWYLRSMSQEFIKVYLLRKKIYFTDLFFPVFFHQMSFIYIGTEVVLRYGIYILNTSEIV